jgi:hypothetical protein
MMFLFKKKKIILDCFTWRADTHEFFPIQQTKKFYPEWWKNIPQMPLGELSMRHCQGLIETYQHGFVVPLWSDVHVQFDSKTREIKHTFSDRLSKFEQHGYSQVGDFVRPEDFCHLKFIAPWQIECNEDIPFTWGPATWNLQEKNFLFNVLSGVVNFKFQNSAHINVLLNSRIGDIDMLVNAGQPMVHSIPLSDRELDIRNHLLSDDEFNKRLMKFTSTFSFAKRYLQSKKIIENREKEEKKCPFGFGKK